MAKTKAPPKPRISGFCNATLPRTSAYDPHQLCPGCDCRAPRCPCNPEEPMPELDAPAPSSEVAKREPEQVTDPGDAATPEECVAAVHAAAERLNAALKDYGPEDWRDGARLLDRLRKATRVLAQLDSSLVLWLYLHGEHGLHQHVEGIKGEVHITRGRSKERWAAPEAVHAFVDAQMEQLEGEVPDPRVVVDWVLSVVPATASTSLRKTPLRDAGLDLEDFYSSEPGTIQVSL